MSRVSLASAIAVAAAVMMVACKPAPAPAPSAEDAVRAVFTQTAEAWNAGNVDSVLAFLADDVVQMPPDTAFVGKAAVGAAWRLHLTANSDVYTPTIHRVAVSGDLGYVLSTYAESWTPKAGGDTTTVEAQAIDVYRRDAGGTWKLIYEAWFTTKPPLQPRSVGPLAGDAAAVRQTFDQYNTTWDLQNIEGVLAFLAEDVVQLPPDSTFIGKAALSARWRNWLTANTDVWYPTVRDVRTSGDMAYVTDAFTETSTPKAGGASRTITGNGFDIFRRDATGAWKLVFESWYETTPQ